MKKIIVVVFIFIYSNIICQAPQFINFQGAARITNGSVLSNTIVSVKIDFYDAASAGALKFSETHSSVNTNEFGLFNIKIGSVNTIDFPTINWSSGNYFVETTITYGGAASILSPRQQLGSVPYALSASSDWSSGSGSIFPKNVSDKVSIGTLTTTASRLGVTENSNSVSTASITQMDLNGTALVAGHYTLSLTGYAAEFNGRTITRGPAQLGTTKIASFPEICPAIFILEVDSVKQAQPGMSALFSPPKLNASPLTPFNFNIGSVCYPYTAPKRISRKEIVAVNLFIETIYSGNKISVAPNTVLPIDEYRYYYVLTDDPSGNAMILVYSYSGSLSNMVKDKYIRVLVTVKQP